MKTERCKENGKNISETKYETNTEKTKLRMCIYIYMYIYIILCMYIALPTENDEAFGAIKNSYLV